jgi:hypothetical protein
VQHVAAHNGLVEGSSPLSPTAQSCANPEFPVTAEHPRFSAVWAGCNGPFAVSAGNEDRPEADWGPSSLTSEIRFPVRGEGPARDSVRMRQRRAEPQYGNGAGLRMRERAEEVELHGHSIECRAKVSARAFGAVYFVRYTQLPRSVPPNPEERRLAHLQTIHSTAVMNSACSIRVHEACPLALPTPLKMLILAKIHLRRHAHGDDQFDQSHGRLHPIEFKKMPSSRRSSLITMPSTAVSPARRLSLPARPPRLLPGVTAGFLWCCGRMGERAQQIARIERGRNS